jgi:hypothetical protein
MICPDCIANGCIFESCTIGNREQTNPNLALVLLLFQRYLRAIEFHPHGIQSGLACLASSSFHQNMASQT